VVRQLFVEQEVEPFNVAMEIELVLYMGILFSGSAWNY
jgi:hypothetical protein